MEIRLVEGPKTFVDTSAFYALMDRSDRNHGRAGKLWTVLLESGFALVTSNYVILETLALLQNRLGFEAASLWHRDVLGLAGSVWIDEAVHRSAYELWLSIGKRKLSMVDCTSFTLMRRLLVETVFAFDKHFQQQGFEDVSDVIS